MVQINNYYFLLEQLTHTHTHTPNSPHLSQVRIEPSTSIDGGTPYVHISIPLGQRPIGKENYHVNKEN